MHHVLSRQAGLFLFSHVVVATCGLACCGSGEPIYALLYPFSHKEGTAVYRGPSLVTSSQSLNEKHVGTVDKWTSDGVQLFSPPSHHTEGCGFLEDEFR